MQVERDQTRPSSEFVFEAPVPNSIQFSDQKHAEIFKPFQFMDQDKLNELGHELQREAEQATQDAADNALLKQPREVFLARMEALVSVLERWLQPDSARPAGLHKEVRSPLARLSVDFLYISRLQNLISEYWQYYARICHHQSLPDQRGPYEPSRVMKVAAAMRQMTYFSQNCAFFGCLQPILLILTETQEVKSLSLVQQRERVALCQELTIMVETLFGRMFAQKRPFQMLFGNQENWDRHFKKVCSEFQAHCSSLIENFCTLSQLLLHRGGKGSTKHLKALKEQEGCELEARLSKLPEKCKALVTVEEGDVRASFSLHAFSLGLLTSQYFDLVKRQRVLYDKHMDPAKVVPNLLMILSSEDPFFTAEVRVAALRVLEFMCELDAHPEFRYSHERSNPYFDAITRHFEDYVAVCKHFTHAYSLEQIEIVRKEVVQDPESVPRLLQRNVFLSQYFMRAFFGFLFVLVSLRTRAMQTQLLPQLVQPIIGLVTVKPSAGAYVLNLDCQKSALQLLKEITRSNVAFDDSFELGALLDRLKAELAILRDDFECFDPQAPSQGSDWSYFSLDDSRVPAISMSRRQDLIGSLLRFLCYSIVRMDPNQISVNQNFVAHSRKVLETRLFEDCLKDFVFAQNPAKEAPEQERTKYEKVVDPIYLPCVQLFTYVFDDLPQKIGEYANGLLGAIIDSLSRRVPRQRDFLVLSCKFMRMLLLKEESTKLLLASRLLRNVQELALDPDSYSEFFAFQKKREQLSLLSQLAASSQELSDQMLETNLHNMRQVMDRSWELTRDYLESEAQNKAEPENKVAIERRKDEYARKQQQFEKTVENACYMLLFQVHEQIDQVGSPDNAQAGHNVQRSLAKQPHLKEVLKRVITTPTICSAATNFLMIFGDLVTMIMMLSGKEELKAYIDWLSGLLTGQLASLKKILGVERFDNFDPRDIKKVQTVYSEALVEQDPDKLDLLFGEKPIGGEDLVWVTVAKIHAYLDLLLIAETISRQSQKEELHQVCLDFYLRPEVSLGEESLRTQIVQLEQLLRKFKFSKFLERFAEKSTRKATLLGHFSERIALVDWPEFKMIKEPHNDYEEALNLYYIFEHSRTDSFKLENASLDNEKQRIALTASDEEVPESAPCKKKCIFFLNRVSSVYRRCHKYNLASLKNNDLRKFCRTGARSVAQVLETLARSCSDHLSRPRTEPEEVDFDLVMLKLQITQVVQEVALILQSSHKASRAPPTALFVLEFLESGAIAHIFTLIEWAASLLLTMDRRPGKKLLLHQQVLQESLLAPTSLLSVLITGEFLKSTSINNLMEPNELSAGVAISKLKLTLMRQLYQPMVAFFVGPRGSQLLEVADQYDEKFSQLLEGLYCVLAGCAFFGPKSAFDPENVKKAVYQYQKTLNAKLGIPNPTAAPSGSAANQQSRSGSFEHKCRQLTDMGFSEADVTLALGLHANDFERALDYLCSKSHAQVAEPPLPAPAEPNTDAAASIPMEESKTVTLQQPAVATTGPQSKTNDPMNGDNQTEAVQIDTTSHEVSGQPEGIPMGDARELEAANLLEFRQLRKETVKQIAKSLVETLPSQLRNAPLLKRRMILLNFLCQIEKEEDAEVKEVLKLEVLGLLRTLMARARQAEEGSEAADWMLVSCVRQIMASEHLKLPQEFTLSKLSPLFTQQIAKHIQTFSKLLAYAKPSEEAQKAMTDTQKRAVLITERETQHQIQQCLFNIGSFVNLITGWLDELKTLIGLQNLNSMIKEAQKSGTPPPQLADLTKIVADIATQLKSADASYFADPSPQSMKSDTPKGKAISEELEVDSAQAGAHLQGYFTNIVHFFKELSSVSSYFLSTFAEHLNPIVIKSMRCLHLMGDVGTLGPFDFAKTFTQRNVLRTLLQAKVLDSELAFEQDVWRPNQKSPGSPFSPEQIGKDHHHAILGQFRAVIREVCQPKKDLQRRLEVSLKRQLYKQFLQNFKRGEKIDFIDYLDSVANVKKSATAEAEGPLQSVNNSGSSQQQRARTKAKASVAQKESGFAKPQSRTSKRSKSEDKQSQGQQGSKTKGASKGKDQQSTPPVSNKLLKKLLVKFDDYNSSKLEDFVAFNKIALADTLVLSQYQLLQACAKIAVIKTVQVDDEPPQNVSKFIVKADCPNTTGPLVVGDILTRAYGKVKELVKRDDGAYTLQFARAQTAHQIKDGDNITMTLGGQVHQLTFEKLPVEESKAPAATHPEKKQELRIMLKRQVLRDLVLDPDFNQLQNFAHFGQPGPSHPGHSRDNSFSSTIAPTKTQNDMVSQLLEGLVDQVRGFKMDTLKIIRSPSAFLRSSSDGGSSDPVFHANDTVLKILTSKEPVDGETEKPREEPKLIVDKEATQSVQKQYFVDYSCILNGLVDILDKSPACVEAVARHNDGKTLKFLLRNLFFLMSVQVERAAPHEVVFKNVQNYNAQKLSDRLTITVTLLKQLTTVNKGSSLRHQLLIQDNQRLLVQLMSKNLVAARHSAKPLTQFQSQEAPADPVAHLVESARLVSQYNSVWLLTQFLFYRPTQNPVKQPVDAIINQTIKLEEHVKLHIVKLLLLETQSAHQQMLGQQDKAKGASGRSEIVKDSSSLAFLSHIKRLLDNLEESKFLFNKAKVPCMHMCIWAVTSVLKIFENQSELFVSIQGPPPPPSSDDSDAAGNESGSEGGATNSLAADHEMHASDTSRAAGELGLVPGGAAGEPEEMAEDSDSIDEEEGEDEMEEGESEESYGSEDFMEGNDDLSSNRDQSCADADMLDSDEDEDDAASLDEDEYGLESSSDYDSEEEQALLDMIPVQVAQAALPVKGGSVNDNISVGSLVEVPIELLNPQHVPSNAAAEGQVEAGAQEPDGGEYQDGAGDDAVPREPPMSSADDSYYSIDEQESYEPPHSYGMEVDSGDDFESEPDAPMGAYGNGMGSHSEDGGGPGDMDTFEDFDNYDASGNTFSDDDSENGHHHHHHQHGGPHDRYMTTHQMNSANLPPHVRLWQSANVYQGDPLDSKIVARITKTYEVLESVATSNWPYKTFIAGVQALPLAATENEEIKTDQDQAKPQVFRDEQGDLAVKLNPDQFKDKVPVEKAQQAPKTTPIQRGSALEIEGMDPLFMESLDPTGLQNIADSHQIQTTVVNSANSVQRPQAPSQSGPAQGGAPSAEDAARYQQVVETLQSQPRQMQGQILDQMQRDLSNHEGVRTEAQRSTLNQFLSALYEESGGQAQAQQPVQSPLQQAPQQVEGRARFLSIDTVAVSMLGPNDASRQVQPAAAQEQAEPQGGNNASEDKQKVRIRGSQFMQNSFNDLQDLIAKFTKNEAVSQTQKQCQDILKQHLLPQEAESAEEKFSKIHDCMQMALVGFKIFEENDLQIQSRIRLLFRIPSLRICLILRVVKLLTSEVSALEAHRDACLAANEFSAYRSKEQMPEIDKDNTLVLQEMPLDKTIQVTLAIIQQLQECLTTLGLSKAATQQSIEIAKPVDSDPLLARFAELSDSHTDTSLSIIEQVLFSLHKYFTIVSKDAWVLPLAASKPAAKTGLYNQVLASLRKTLQPLSKVAKLRLPVRQLCELVAAPKWIRLTKVGHQHARRILNDINERDNQAQVGAYLDDRLEVALRSTILQLQSKQPADSSVSGQESFVSLLEESKELLKLSGGIQKLKNVNICRQATLASLFDSANKLLSEEQHKAESQSRDETKSQDDNKKSAFNASSSAFMYRTEIKEMVLLLFALCEYNLRIVFASGAVSVDTHTQTHTLSQSPQQVETTKPPSESQQLIDTRAVPASEPEDQEMLDNQAEIYKVLSDQIAAQRPQTQQPVQEATQATSEVELDRRLRTIIGFFIHNKKLINVFIRVNQQVVNVQLKNLVVKIPQILEFDTKRLIWRVMLKKTKQKVKGGGQWDVLVRREQAFDDSFALMRNAKTDEWKTPLRISFQDEAGVDEGGLTKEWFSLLSKHMFNEDMALFLKASQGSTYFPNPKSVIQADHLDLFSFIGKFVGKALIDQQLLDCYFVKAFYKLILDMPLEYRDLEDYDQELFKSLEWILANEGAEHLCSYFVETQDYFGESKEQELCPGGAEKLVTDSNKEEYVKLVANYRLKQAVESQITAFKNGLFQIIPRDLIKIFDNRELELLISGLQVVDIDDLRENTAYQGYTANSKPVLLFWEALREFDNSERAEFIQFVTGSSKVPVEGFKGLRGQNGLQKFTIAQINSFDQNRLPQSHTCVNQLDLPQYQTKETMKRMLLTASKEGKTFTIA